MNFKDLLNEYIEKIACSAKELAEASELSSVVISRYRSGEREPAADSEQLAKISSGISLLANKRGLNGYDADRIKMQFQTILSDKANASVIFTDNFRRITDMLHINMKDLATYTNFETSYLYRIRSGQRHPSDPSALIEKISKYIVKTHTNMPDKTAIAKLLCCTVEDLSDSTKYYTTLVEWLSNNSMETEPQKDNQIASFLQKLDSFDLDEYIRSIHFDELKVPSLPFYKASSKHYYGVEEMKKGELDFFRATVLSKSKEPVFMCSDMPMADMAEDMDFNKKWMFGIAMTLKKGLNLNIIHNINRPFSEMMLGLEAWIPIYMTGQVSPYHLPNISTNVYHHFNYVSGSVALSGECIEGYHSDGQYYLTSNKEELAYYKKKAKNLLSKAKPLMEIYRSDANVQFRIFETSFAAEAGTRNFMLSAPPIYTISDKLLEQIFARLALSSGQQNTIRSYITHKRSLAANTLQNNKFNVKLCNVSKEEFEAHPVALSLSGLFDETDICYTYEEYLEHITLTQKFEKDNRNFKMNLSDKLKFRNIQVEILDKKCIVISKEKAPVIHFVIRHNKMIDSFNWFYLSEC